MAIEYRELTLDDDFEQCLELQRRVYGYTETELVSPLIYRMIARNNPPLGILVGAFNHQDGGSELIGLMLGFATFADKSVYAASLGFLPAYQAGICSYKLMLCFRDASMARGIQTMYGIHEPLESNLARLYYGGIGYLGFQYNVDGRPGPIPSDKILARWEFDSARTLAKLSHTKSLSLAELLESAPVAGPDDFPEVKQVLMEVPQDFIRLKSDDPSKASQIRLETRSILNEYVNKRKYIMTDCVSGKIAGERKSFYVLDAPQASKQANGGD